MNFGNTSIAQSCSSYRYRKGLKADQIPLSGFIICSVVGEISLLVVLQVLAQLSPVLEDVPTHPG